MSEPAEDITGQRRLWRREMIARREALAPARHAELCQRIVTHAAHALPRPAVAAFCWPIRGEPDVRALLADWQAAGTRAALPVVVTEQAPLIFRQWQADSPLVADRYGIPTPAEGATLQPDLLLIPLNAFDAAGFRLGYGGGYFDRTLAALQPRPLTVGVGFECNRLPSILPQPHDLPLDWIITEAGAFRTPAEVARPA